MYSEIQSKKFTVLLHTLSAYIKAYSSGIKITCLIPGNVCTQPEGMLKPMKTFLLIQHRVERILLKK